MDFDTYDTFQISGATQGDGTTDWDLRVDYLDGSGWHVMKTYTTNWDWGVALGETERKTVPGTGLSDDQQGLKYKNGSGTWVDWPNVDCVQDRELNVGDVWQWHKVNDTHYEVIKNGTTC